jgi:hypothetical protein
MKTSEMIAMLEKNPNLKFKGTNWSDGSILQLDLFGHITIINPKNKICPETVLNYLPSKTDWEIVCEPVTWQEAIQAWAEGKTVKCVLNSFYEGYIFNDFHCKANTQTILSKDMIKGGTWYIEK